MTVPYELGGRVRQKARTRDALTSAARRLLAGGTPPTVEEAAREASVSRTTAYRYFPNQDALLAATYPHIEQRSLLGPDSPDDPVERLAVVAEDHSRRILANEAEMRAVLRMSLAGVRPSELPMHRGLRVSWIEDALSPLRDRLEPDELERLVYGIAATLGIESFAWLTDVAGVEREEAAAILRFNAMALLRGAIDGER